ncbi:hypothetical protein [Halopiger xanaduensis]|uniref:Uncharacterized protein n=1 Tax=Halopiger xanaduensis (strain DSM 18323 / JCM 14033 / SH-6) TaxID=797210 RepID=F8D603_HALXS|nr:hypothetical protein [Halopiger xanaduensis]AEH37733.1 hypothetical protein Halxa_3119 [Halopiger xanaduensis SH-6]
MVSSRTLTALAGLALSVLVSVAAWIYLETVLLFLFLPFVPFLLSRSRWTASDAQAMRQCPECGFRTTESSYEYCPRDGSRLREPRP